MTPSSRLSHFDLMKILANTSLVGNSSYPYTFNTCKPSYLLLVYQDSNGFQELVTSWKNANITLLDAWGYVNGM